MTAPTRQSTRTRRAPARYVEEGSSAPVQPTAATSKQRRATAKSHTTPKTTPRSKSLSKQAAPAKSAQKRRASATSRLRRSSRKSVEEKTEELDDGEPMADENAEVEHAEETQSPQVDRIEEHAVQNEQPKSKRRRKSSSAANGSTQLATTSDDPSKNGGPAPIEEEDESSQDAIVDQSIPTGSSPEKRPQEKDEDKITIADEAIDIISTEISAEPQDAFEKGETAEDLQEDSTLQNAEAPDTKGKTNPEPSKGETPEVSSDSSEEVIARRRRSTRKKRPAQQMRGKSKSENDESEGAWDGSLSGSESAQSNSDSDFELGKASVLDELAEGSVDEEEEAMLDDFIVNSDESDYGPASRRSKRKASGRTAKGRQKLKGRGKTEEHVDNTPEGRAKAAQDEEVLNRLFGQLDPHGNLRITARDILKVADDHGQFFDAEEIADMVRFWDSSGTNTIDRANFGALARECGFLKPRSTRRKAK